MQTWSTNTNKRAQCIGCLSNSTLVWGGNDFWLGRHCGTQRWHSSVKSVSYQQRFMQLHWAWKNSHSKAYGSSYEHLNKCSEVAFSLQMLDLLGVQHNVRACTMSSCETSILLAILLAHLHCHFSNWFMVSTSTIAIDYCFHRLHYSCMQAQELPLIFCYLTDLTHLTSVNAVPTCFLRTVFLYVEINASSCSALHFAWCPVHCF